MKNLKKIAFVAAGICAMALSANAQNPNYEPGDLVLFFQKEGGTNTVYANLGNAAVLFRGAGAGASDGVNRIDFLDISASLASAFGAGWATDTTIYAGLAGVWGSSATNSELYNGDPHRTIYTSRARDIVGTVGEAGSAAWDMVSAGNTAMTTGASGIFSQNNILETQYSDAVVVSPTSVSFIDDQNPFLFAGVPGPAFGAFDGGVQQRGSASSFGIFGPAGSVEFALDLYRILARTNVVDQVAGDLRVGSYEGTVTVNSSGMVSFVVLDGAAPDSRIISLSGNLSFGNVTVDQTAQRTMTISNGGNTEMTVTSIDYPSGFTGTWSGSIPAGGSQDVEVTFSPTEAQVYGGDVIVNSNKTAGTDIIAISGTGTAIVATSRIVSLSGNMNFGTVTVGSSAQRQLTIANTGNSLLTVSNVNYPAGFVGSFNNGTIAAGNSIISTITFTPNSAQSFAGTITVVSDATSGDNTIEVTASGATAVVATAPATPWFIKMKKKGKKMKILRWGDVALETGYRVQIRPKGKKSWKTFRTLRADTTNLRIKGKKRLTARFRVSSFNAVGASMPTKAVK